MMNVTDYTNIKTLLIKFKEKSDALYAKATALSNYATIEWVGTQIPSVGNGTVIIKQNGTSKGSFTMNQSGGATINLTDTTYSSLSAVSGGTDKSLVTTGEKYAWNSKQAAISDLATIRSNAATAYGWGDHSKAGYLKTIATLTINGTAYDGTTPTTVNFPTSLPANGGNADTVDGLHASSFAQWKNCDNVDTAYDFGFWKMFATGSGSPTGKNNSQFITVPYRKTTGNTTPDFAWQILAPNGDDPTHPEDFYVRTGLSTTWNPWRKLYHSGNSNNTSTVWSAKRLATTYNLICPYTWNQKGSLTGTLVLSLPYGFNSMMQCIELSVYDYSSVNDGSRGATKFFINGYNYYSSNSRWINPCAFSIGNKNVKVRLGYYNNKCCILIGETNTTWEHPGLSVDNIYGYYANHVGTYKDDDWSCAVLQDESQITHVETASDTPLYAPCYTRSGLPYVTDNDVAAKYLKLTGGTISGWLLINASTLPISELTTDGITSNNTWNSAQNVNLLLRSANNALTISLGGQENERKGIIQVGHAVSSYANFLGDLYLNKFGGNVYIGENLAYHAGNANNISTDWTCKSLVAAGDVKASGWCKAANGLLIEESGVYYTHHSQFGEIDIVKGNEFIWGGKTDTLYFNYRASANETTTVAHYIWNAGSPTTYATHTMGTLTVLGAITATTTIHATTGIYTDGYISAKQASASSDRRLKKDFCKIDNALKYVLKTHYTRFRWKDDNKESIGIIAQEEQNREYGFLVQNNEKIGHLTYDYAASTALLGAAIQEEDSKVEKLKKRVAELEKELSNLKRKWQH